MPRLRHQHQLFLPLGRLIEALAVYGQNKTIRGAVDVKYRNRIALQCINRAHGRKCIAVAKLSVEIHRRKDFARNVGVTPACLQHILNIRKGAVRDRKVHLRLIAKRRDRCCRAERFTMQAECHPIPEFCAEILYDFAQILPLANTVSTGSSLIFAVSA